MWIIPKDRSRDTRQAFCEKLAYAVSAALRRSRFSAQVFASRVSSSRKFGVKIETVRLDKGKDYCGAHPGPCRALFARKHKKSRCLEGLDWVAFNHFLNDVLDSLAADADVFSFNRESLENKYFIRAGRLRRVGYPYQVEERFAHWTQGDVTENGDFADYCGKPNPPLSVNDVDMSTPGLLAITAEQAASLEVALV